MDSLRKIVMEGGYDYVVNCIGILNQFAEGNHPLAVFINGYLPHYLAQITENCKTSIIHLGTDCVFSGDRGGYKENDVPDGRTFYDRTKAIGELVDDKNLTLRDSIVGPDINDDGIGLLNWFMKQSGTVKGFTRAIWTGMTTLQLAKTIEQAAIERATGLYNMVPDRTISKYDLLCLFNEYIRKDRIEIIPNEDFVVDKSLVRTNYDGFSYRIPDYEYQVKELGEWMREHRDMYQNYIL
jgi:dTDP-4-dehydrorhamnose reductase